jgi:hypothetical protein
VQMQMPSVALSRLEPMGREAAQRSASSREILVRKYGQEQALVHAYIDGYRDAIREVEEMNVEPDRARRLLALEALMDLAWGEPHGTR